MRRVEQPGQANRAGANHGRNDVNTPVQQVHQPLRGRAVGSSDALAAVFSSLSRAPLRAALLGRGIQQSRTPHMHIREGDRLGLSYAYGLVDFDQLGLRDDDLADVISAAARGGLAGLNVTHPFKQAVVPLVDELSADGAAIGALNTVVLRGGRAVGHNTDCWGFAESFRRGMPGAALGKVLLIGAGGAGMAVARALLDQGAAQVGCSTSIQAGPKRWRKVCAHPSARTVGWR
jgi:shikimate dehydrogenase